MKCLVCLCTLNNECVVTNRERHYCSEDCKIEFKRSYCNGCGNVLTENKYIESGDELKYCDVTDDPERHSCAKVYETLKYYKLDVDNSWLNQDDFPSALILRKLVEIKDKSSTISKQINRNKKEQEKVTADRKMLQIVRRFVKGNEEFDNAEPCNDNISVTCPTCTEEFDVYHVKWI